MRRSVVPNRALALSIAILLALVALTISGVFATTTGATPATQTFTVEATAPAAPAITSGPADASTDTDGDFSFAFTGAEAGGTYQCSLDTATASYSSCTSPKSYTGQQDGSYTFLVRQVDAAGNNGTAATRSFSVDVPSSPYPGIRFTKTVGYQPTDGTAITASYVDNKYATMMKPAYHGANGDVKFMVRENLAWGEVLDNPGTTPSVANMSNHNWSGYNWDTTDAVANALGAQCVGDGDCVIGLSLQVSGGASNTDTTPQFMINEGLAWVGNNSKGRIKFYNASARSYVEAFYNAALDRYGNDPDIGSVKLAEYWPGGIKPTDWNSSGGQAAFESGYETVLQNVVNSAPTDANGDRVAIYQSNPIFGATSFTCAEMIAMGVGQAGADPQMFEEAADRKACIEDAHGVVPQALPGDAPFHTKNYQTTYDGTANPFGYGAGNRVISLAQVLWFYGHCGPSPMDQEVIVKGTLDGQFQSAMDQFGPGGDDYSTNCSQATDDWGGVPHND